MFGSFYTVAASHVARVAAALRGKRRMNSVILVARTRGHGMARAISDEELQLKKRARRRLVGAVVLVTAVAVILPMVLDSEPRPVNQTSTYKSVT